tara:strand:+ start:5597 stop:6772 length:1176 start_codon:yes stop_codon:yes gene_type:complete
MNQTARSILKTDHLFGAGNRWGVLLWALIMVFASGPTAYAIEMQLNIECNPKTFIETSGIKSSVNESQLPKLEDAFKAFLINSIHQAIAEGTENIEVINPELAENILRRAATTPIDVICSHTPNHLNLNALVQKKYRVLVIDFEFGKFQIDLGAEAFRQAVLAVPELLKEKHRLQYLESERDYTMESYQSGKTLFHELLHLLLLPKEEIFYHTGTFKVFGGVYDPIYSCTNAGFLNNDLKNYKTEDLEKGITKHQASLSSLYGINHIDRSSWSREKKVEKSNTAAKEWKERRRKSMTQFQDFPNNYYNLDPDPQLVNYKSVTLYEHCLTCAQLRFKTETKTSRRNGKFNVTHSYTSVDTSGEGLDLVAIQENCRNRTAFSLKDIQAMHRKK